MTVDQLVPPQDDVPVTVARLDAVVALARLLALGAEADPTVRLAELEARRADLDAEIARVRAGDVSPLSPAEVLDLRALVARTGEGLRDSPAVADALLSPTRRDDVAAVLARVGLPRTHHAWLAPAPLLTAAPTVPHDDLPWDGLPWDGVPWDGVDDAPDVGEDPGAGDGADELIAELIAEHLRQDLRHRPERPLADLLADRPLQGGLGELVAWLTLADDAVETLVGEATDDVAWTDPDGRTRVATLPRVVFRRAGTPTPTRENPR